MAKHKDNQPSTPGKLTIMVVQLEGNDATLQEGIRTFKEAMGRAMPQAAPRAYLPPPASLAALSPPLADEYANGTDNADLQEPPGGMVIDTTASDHVPPSKSAKSRKPPVMQFVKNLDLHPKGKTSLNSFVEQKKPTKQFEKITVCVYYLCRILEVEGVTAHHVYTCLKHIGAATPNDLPQEMRNVANRKGYIDVSDPGDVKITNPGDNFVDHNLPAS